MKKRLYKGLSLVLACLLALSLCSCGEAAYSNKGKNENGTLVWYLGGNNLMADKIDVEKLFKEYEDTVDPAAIYSTLELTEEMLHGSYALNNMEKDLKTVRKEIPFEDVTFTNGTASVTSLPVAVYLGEENICSTETGFDYAEYREITDHEVAVLKFATADEVGHTPCIYEIDGNRITFKLISQTSADEEPFTYELSGIEFTYDFELSGPYLTLTKGEHSLKLKAYCFTENTDKPLTMYGYSLPSSPLIEDLDYFSCSEIWSYAVRSSGSFIDICAFKMDDVGRFTVYLEDREMVGGERDIFAQQYAYIIQSGVGAFGTDFGIILLDGKKMYEYTDDITEREARSLEEQGVEVEEIPEETIKTIAEKKSDLFQDLYTEFEAKGINVTINRRSGEIAMDASVLFGGDSAEITDDGKALLNQFLDAYTSIIYSEKYDGFITKTIIEGHTAPVSGSTYESGLPLSEERAANVLAYCLSSETGVDTSKLASTLESVGLSNSKPVYNSDGEIDMAACRRVSFRFMVNLDKQG